MNIVFLLKFDMLMILFDCNWNIWLVVLKKNNRKSVILNKILLVIFVCIVLFGV